MNLSKKRWKKKRINNTNKGGEKPPTNLHNMNSKELKSYFDLYPSSVIFDALKIEFNHWSFCKKSVPSLGSACYKINKLNSNCGAKIKKVINHRSGEITLCTNLGFLKFTNL